MIQRDFAGSDGAPHHIAIIMDGNRRWAAARGLPAIEGHRRGMRTLRRIMSAAQRAGVGVLTVYAFSEENWQREASEVAALMDLGAGFARREARALARENIRARTIGRTDRLPTGVAEAFAHLTSTTAAARGLLVNLAIDYSARGELRSAIRSLARDVAAGRLAPDAICDASIAERLFTSDCPDPDLLIRTGGELRLSNFLLYQCAYTELLSVPDAWPSFDEAAFTQALATFRGRQRRFGR